MLERAYFWSPDLGAPITSPLWIIVCPLVAGPRLLLAHQWVGLTGWLTGCDYSGQADVQGLTPQCRSCLSGALVPAKAALRECLFWCWLGGALVWSEAGH